MKTCFRSHYFDDSDARTSFKHFLLDLHGLDLSLWEAEGFWDEDYIPFSFFVDGQLVSHLCLYSLHMTLQGEEHRVAQISSVGTLPEFRRRGLNRELTRRAMEWCRHHEHLFTFLFADDAAIPFYEATGFHAAPQHRFFCSPPPVTPVLGRLVPLDVMEKLDRSRLLALAERRTPVSNLLGYRSLRLFMFHALYTLRDCLSFLPEFDLIVASSRADDTLFIHDLIGPELPPFALLQPYLQLPGVKRYEFGFVPDRLQIESTIEPDDTDDGTHVDDRFPLNGIPFRFPYTVHA